MRSRAGRPRVARLPSRWIEDIALATSRIAPCSHRPPCPGCPDFGRRGVAPDAAASFAAFAREHCLDSPPIFESPPGGHRHRARLAVRGRSRSPKIGLFQEGTHRIVDIPRCPVHHPVINEAVASLKLAIRETGTRPYADVPHEGVLRTVQLAVERATERLQVVLVANAPDSACIAELAREVEVRLGARLQGLFFNGQPERSNTLLGPHWEHLAGEPMLRERIGGVECFLPPGAFGQNHLPLFDRLAQRARALVPDGANVAEFYAGVGAIGLGLLERVASVRFNERSADAVDGLRRALAARSDAEKAIVAPGAASEQLGLLEESEVVIVDPPRRGLEPDLVAALCAAPPARLIYVACGRESFLADARRLVEEGRGKGGLRLVGLELYDLFPFTGHVEALAWFDRGAVRGAP